MCKWRNRSPLETGLILMLIVTVSFLIGMIIIYTSTGKLGRQLFNLLVAVKYIDCGKACPCIDHFQASVSKIPAKPIIQQVDFARGFPVAKTNSSGQKISRSVSIDGCKTEDTNIAAIIKIEYLDDIYDTTYLCPAAVITPYLLLTSHFCIHNINVHLYDIYARIGSHYWSKGGHLHGIKEIISDEYQVIAFLELKIKIQQQVHLMTVGNLINFSKDAFNIYGWHKSFKHVKLINVNLKLLENNTCDKIHTNGIFCGITEHKLQPCLEYYMFLPVIDDILIGVYNKVECNNVVNTYKFYSIGKYASTEQKVRLL